MQPKFWKFGLALVAIAALATPAPAAPGTITATASPLGPILVDTTFTVTMRLSGYTDATEIDGFQFNVLYDSTKFSFVLGSFNLGTGAGADQQWLSKTTQEAGGASGYILDSSGNSGGTPGTVVITMYDGEGPAFPLPEQGTTSSDGFLVAFDLKGTAEVVDSPITLSAFGAGGTLLDIDLAAAGSPGFAGTTMTVVPEPATWVMLLAGTLGLLALRFRRS